MLCAPNVVERVLINIDSKSIFWFDPISMPNWPLRRGGRGGFEGGIGGGLCLLNSSQGLDSILISLGLRWSAGTGAIQRASCN